MAFTLSGFADEIDKLIVNQFEHLNKLGISYFEARGINGTNISEISDAELAELKGNMQKYGIKVSSIGSPIGKIGINDDFEEHLKLLNRVIYIAKELGARYIRIFSFYIPEGEEPEKYRDEVMRRMKAMAEVAEAEGVILLHENEKDIYGDTAARCREVLDTVASKNLRAVFDPANFVQCGEVTYPYAFELMKPYIEHMHIKDSTAGGDIVPAGCGEGKIAEILGTLKKDGYNGFVSLEPHLGTFSGLENLETSDDMLKLESSTPEKFTLAYESLKKIIDNI